jgi:hypothetical protein
VSIGAVIIEVFKVEKWYPVKRTYGPKCTKAGEQYEAYGFDGDVAEESVRSLYIINPSQTGR